MAAPTLPLLTRLGSYELVRLLAQGGMADIYLARQDGADRHVAVKVLNHARSRDEEAQALFHDEARLVAMLHHQHLAGVHDVAVAGGVHYLAMEFVHGADLRELLAVAGKLDVAIPYATSLSIIAAAAQGLDHAHRRCDADGKPLHLVHRDVSLSNIMVGHDGTVKVVDFGIATATISSHATNPGVVRGKASYMSPEQCLGDPVDLRTDVFALGVVLYELTTGKRCFHGHTDFERMLAVVQGSYVRPCDIDPTFPSELAAVIERALALDPAERFSSAASLIDALERAAAALGISLGTASIVATMRALYGDVSEPWAGEAADATEPAQLPVPRRFPRGTDCSGIATPDEDEQPTRGRRSAPRLWTSRLAA